jgi:Fe-S cluster biogenesis protein NfuA
MTDASQRETAELLERIERVMKEQVRPMLHMEGGHIEVLDIHDGVLRVRLHGTCSGCPSTVLAVIMEIEQQLRKHVPEVAYLEALP